MKYYTQMPASDDSPSERELGITYRDPRTTVADMIAALRGVNHQALPRTTSTSSSEGRGSGQRGGRKRLRKQLCGVNLAEGLTIAVAALMPSSTVVCGETICVTVRILERPARMSVDGGLDFG